MPPQTDLTKNQDAGDFASVVLAPDYQALRDLGAHYNADVDWVRQHCVAGSPPDTKATTK